METEMKNQITYNVKTEIKPGVFEEYVKDDVDINQEYLAIPREILLDQNLKANEKMIMGYPHQGLVQLLVGLLKRSIFM